MTFVRPSSFFLHISNSVSQHCTPFRSTQGLLLWPRILSTSTTCLVLDRSTTLRAIGEQMCRVLPARLPFCRAAATSMCRCFGRLAVQKTKARCWQMMNVAPKVPSPCLMASAHGYFRVS